MNLFNAHDVDEYHTKIVIFADISNNGEKITATATATTAT